MKRVVNKFTVMAVLALALFTLPEWLRYNSTTFNLFFPPDDLFEPLASQALTNDAQMYNFNVKHKYPGHHEIRVKTSSFDGIGVLLDAEFTTEVEISSSTKVLLSEEISKSHSQFWGDDYGGIVLASYRVSDQIPINEPAKIKVLITGDVSNFITKYGDSKVQVRKSSDK